MAASVVCGGGLHGAVALAASLNTITIHARRSPGCKAAFSDLLTAVVIYVFDVEGVNMTGDIPKYSERNVDAQVGTTPRDDGDTRRRDLGTWVSAPFPASAMSSYSQGAHIHKMVMRTTRTVDAAPIFIGNNSSGF
ncbi:hypothetical protein GGR55DRAFT_108906 [Xylaria sp. FL0064]|nr:hypothetical protein GGR55DRAFT_108906 [Xylaria sp. FL0064]